MVCSVKESLSSERVHYDKVVVAHNALLQESKRQPNVTVEDMRSSGVTTVNEVMKHETPAVNQKSVWMLAYCCIGIMVSFTLHGVALEKITTHRVLGELSMTFVSCVFNLFFAMGLSRVCKEKPSNVPHNYLTIIGALAFSSTIASMVALRYVTYITRILGKSCKSIPVMIIGATLGKKHPLKKYVSVIVLSIGVALFLLGTSREKQYRVVKCNEGHDTLPEQERTPNMVLGCLLLVLSLIMDGATGALEDKFMEAYHIGAFDLMYYVNSYKALFSAIGMVINGEVPVFLQYVVPSLPTLLMLSLMGAFGQAFVFFTISNFGALTTAIIGTCRKVLSVLLSIFLFGHLLSLKQTVGLALSFAGIGLNWVNIRNCFAKHSLVHTAGVDPLPMDDMANDSLIESSSDDTADSELDAQELSMSNYDTADHETVVQTARKLELVKMWYRETACESEVSSSNTDATDINNLAAQAV